MARAIADGLAAGGAEVKVLPLGAVHRSDVATELLEAGGLIVGSPTINNQLFPTVADLLTYIRGLKPQNKVGAAFGSFGWSGESVRILTEDLREMGVEIVSDAVSAQYVPDAAALESCQALGEAVAKRVAPR